LFEVDVWHQGVFELTKSHGGKASNAEQLKNFTDIYDFAIFIFSPDDKIISQFRKNKDGKYKKALATRHNIVFEFGLFLGRIGAKRSFILFDDDSADFVNDFFTDLKENIADTKEIKEKEVDVGNKFRIELYPYKGTSGKKVSLKQRKKEFDYEDLKVQVEKIKSRVTKTFKGIDISFLPSTSLAIGYYKNFVKIVMENMLDIISNSVSDTTRQEIESKEEIKKLAELLIECEVNQFKIIIPDTIQEADPEIIKPFLMNCSERKSIPGKSRNMNVNLKPNTPSSEKKSFIVYDVPTTMFSSVEAVNMLNPHSNIKELLSEKEKRNFVKVLKFKINKEPNKALKKFMKKVINFISWKQFLKETT